MLSPLPENPASTPVGRVGELFALMRTLRGEAAQAASDDAFEDLLDSMESTALEIAEIRTPSIDSCRQKASLLRERLVDMLDVSVPGEAVTLALVASLMLDLAMLES
jgi:hypothetical protein